MDDPIYRRHNQTPAPNIAEHDRELLDAMDRETLYRYLYMHVKNVYRVDGLYFLGAEKRYGMDVALALDEECWRYMGATEARELKELLGIENPGPIEALTLLRHTGWGLHHHGKSWEELPDGSVEMTVHACRVQLIRQEKGLPLHLCRPVREANFKTFIEECNPALTAPLHLLPAG